MIVWAGIRIKKWKMKEALYWDMNSVSPLCGQCLAVSLNVTFLSSHLFFVAGRLTRWENWCWPSICGSQRWACRCESPCADNMPCSKEWNESELVKCNSMTVYGRVTEVQQPDLVQYSYWNATAWPCTIELLKCNITMYSRFAEVQQHDHVQ